MKPTVSKIHRRPKVKLGLAPTERGPERTNDGDLIIMRCRSCETEVLAPARTKSVRCGTCVQKILRGVGALV